MDELAEQGLKVFRAGSPADPRSPSKLGRCLSCNRIVHYSPALRKWVYEDGTFHTNHLIEVPQD